MKNEKRIIILKLICFSVPFPVAIDSRLELWRWIGNRNLCDSNGTTHCIVSRRSTNQRFFYPTTAINRSSLFFKELSANYVYSSNWLCCVMHWYRRAHPAEWSSAARSAGDCTVLVRRRQIYKNFPPSILIFRAVERKRVIWLVVNYY